MEPTRHCHVVALPYPGRGHINPTMNICKQLLSKKPDILVTFVVTEEWLSLLGPDPTPDNLVFATLPNVIPSEHGRAGDFPGFVKAVNTILEAPFAELLDGLVPQPNVIVADTYITWVAAVANRRNIPVASLWTMSASVFSVFRHFELLKVHGHFPANLSEKGHEIVDYIPGIPSTRLVDLCTFSFGDGRKVLPMVVEAVSNVSKVQYLLFTCAYELESEVYDSLKKEIPLPIYPIGPSIPLTLLESDQNKNYDVPGYIQWLDSQPKDSVLYISLGSFLSVSSVQLDEIVAGINNSGVRFVWVARGDVAKIKEGCDINNGFVVPWCDQLKVLCHSSIGGFWTHCGWNSTLESLFSGVPMLTFPIFWDQIPNSKRIVEDWKIGNRVRKEMLESERQVNLVTKNEIAKLVRRFMDLDSDDGIAMRERVKVLKDACRQAIAKGGSSDTNLDDFIRDISQ